MVTLEDLLKKLTESWNKFSDWISTGLGAVWSFFAPLIDEIRSVLEGVWEELLNAFQEAWNLAQDAFDKASQAFDKAVTAVADAWDDITSAIDFGVADAKLYADGLWGTVTGMTEEFVYGLVDGLRSVVSDIDVRLSSAESFLATVDSTLAMILTELETMVSDAISKLLDTMIETEEESEKYKG